MSSTILRLIKFIPKLKRWAFFYGGCKKKFVKIVKSLGVPRYDIPERWIGPAVIDTLNKFQEIACESLSREMSDTSGRILKAVKESGDYRKLYDELIADSVNLPMCRRCWLIDTCQRAERISWKGCSGFVTENRGDG